MSRLGLASITAVLVLAACAPSAPTSSPPSEPVSPPPSPQVTVEPTASPSATASPAPSETSSPAPTPSPNSGPFHDLLAGRIEPRECPDGPIWNAAAFSDQVFLVAADAIYRSADGTSWVNVGLPPMRDHTPQGLAAGDDRMIAWSEWGGIWSTLDGVTWAAHGERTLPLGDGFATWVSAVVPWQGGFVAAGALAPEVCPSCIGDAAIWYSMEGLDWQLARRGPADAELTMLVAGPDVLVAASNWDEGIPPKNLWGSSDGASWAKLADVYAWDDEDLWDHGISGLVGGSRVFALAAGYVGWEEDDDHLESVGLWELVNGEWVDRTANELVNPAAYDRVLWRSMVELADGYALVGEGRRVTDGSNVALAWASPDGLSWQLIDLPQPEGTAVAVVGNSDRLVILGFAGGTSLAWVTEGP